MKITIESTSKIITANGIAVRMWQGITDKGVPIHCFINRVIVSHEISDIDSIEFIRDLEEHTAPREDIVIVGHEISDIDSIEFIRDLEEHTAPREDIPAYPLRVTVKRVISMYFRLPG